MKRKLIQQATVLKAVDISEMSGTTAKVGEVLDFYGYSDAILTVTNAASTGTPTATAVTVTMVEGDTNSPATSVTFSATPTVINALAANTTNYHIDLRGFKRYGKFTITPAFTDGTSPKVLTSGTITLGGKNVEPAPSAVTVYTKA